MNVMNRKLFANRDARRRLANMGGIMVSSPELMQAAQMFQTGGQATVLKTVAHPFGDYDIMSDGSAILKMTGSVLDPNNKGNTALLEELRNLPAKGTETENKTSNILSGIFGGGGGGGDEVLEVSTENPYQSDIDAAVESYTGTSTNENNVPVFPPTDEQVEEVKKKVDKTDNVPVFPPTDEQVEEVKKKVDEPIVLPEIQVTGDSKELTPEEKETANKNLENLDSAISNLETGANVAEAGLSAALENSGVETKDLSLKQKVESMEDLFAGIFGETDEDTKKANLLTAAYTFFQIAAGASPNALTNIANGVALGMEELMKRQQAGKDRKDKLKIMAVEQVFAEKAAEKDAQLRRELAATKAGSGYRDPRNPIDAFLNAKSDAEGLLKDITFRKTLLEQNNVAPENQEAWLDQWSTNRAMKTVQSAYGSQTPEFGGTQTQTTPTATDLPTISTQEEYDALPPGSEFIQIVDGKPQKRRKE